MTPTRIRTLALVAVLAAALGWGSAQVMQALTGRALPVPWLAAATLWILALALVLWTLSCRSRLPRRRTPGTGDSRSVGGSRSVAGPRPASAAARPPLNPIVAARTAALAMAASRVGSAVGGLYAGIALGVAAMATEAARQVLWTAIAAACACAVVTACAYWLETMCRLPDDDGPGVDL